MITRDCGFVRARRADGGRASTAALELARQRRRARAAPTRSWSIGGSDVFAAAMPLADRLEITHVHASPEGDVTFPPIDPTLWREVSARPSMPPGPQDDAGFTVATYVKR